MTLDEQLRLALHARVDALAPLPDPFAGVERRARGIRRRRTAAAVAATALTVVAVVGAVPLLVPDRGGAPGPSDVAASTAPSTAPSTGPSTTPYAPPGALDVDHPWPYRGSLRLEDQRDAISAAWTAAHPGSTRLVPLFGQVDEPSGQPEVVVLDRSSEQPRWGVLQESEAGWTIVVDTALSASPRETALVAALPGDTSPRLLVVASPDTDWLGYDATGQTRVTGALRQMSAPAPGVGLTALEPGDPAHDAVVGIVDGAQAWRVDAPGVEGPDASPAATPDRVASDAPANVVDWPAGGGPVDAAPDRGLVLSARAAYAASRRGLSVSDVQEKVLVAGREGDVTYLLGQFWVPGDAEADTFAAIVHGGDDVEGQLYRPLSGGGTTDVVALQLPRAQGAPTSTLVVVERPGLGLLSYSPDGEQPFVPRPAGGPSRVALFPRGDAAERAGRDEVRVVTPARGLRTYSVVQLLCGRTSCG